MSIKGDISGMSGPYENKGGAFTSMETSGSSCPCSLDEYAKGRYPVFRETHIGDRKGERRMSVVYVLRCSDGIIAAADRRETIRKNDQIAYNDTVKKIFVIPNTRIVVTASGQITFGQSHESIESIVQSCTSKETEPLIKEICEKIQSCGPVETSAYIWATEAPACVMSSANFMRLEIKPTYNNNIRLGETIVVDKLRIDHGLAFFNGENWAVNILKEVLLPSLPTGETIEKVKDIFRLILAVKPMVPYDKQTISDTIDMVAIQGENVEWHTFGKT